MSQDNDDNGSSRINYFRDLIDRELSIPWDAFDPKQLARVFARAAKEADPDILLDPEFQEPASTTAAPPYWPDAETAQALIDMGQRLLADRKNNDHCTAEPVFVVQRLHRQFGIDTDYDPAIAWLDESGEEITDKAECERLEAAYQKDRDSVPEGYTRTGVAVTWEYVDAYLTPKAAADRVARGGSKYRIDVNSAYRNHEIKLIRRFLMELAKAGALAKPVTPTPPEKPQAWAWLSHGRHITVDRTFAKELTADGETVIPLYPPQPPEEIKVVPEEIRDLLSSGWDDDPQPDGTRTLRVSVTPARYERIMALLKSTPHDGVRQDGVSPASAPSPAQEQHWEIIGHSGLVIGCTYDQDDVLAEEPDATFRPVSPSQCRICGDES